MNFAFALFLLVFKGAFARLWLPLLLGLIVLPLVIGGIAVLSGGAFLKAAIITAIAYAVVVLVVLVCKSAGAVFGRW